MDGGKKHGLGALRISCYRSVVEQLALRVNLTQFATRLATDGDALECLRAVASIVRAYLDASASSKVDVELLRVVDPEALHDACV